MATTNISTVKLAQHRTSPAQLVESVRANIAGLAGDPYFTNITPPLAVLAAACDALEAADLQVATNGGKLDHVVRKQRLRELLALRKELGGYVQAVSGGDPERIGAAAFATRRRPRPVGVLPAPRDLRARMTAWPGELELRWAAVPSRLIYVVQWCQSDPLDERNWSQLTMVGMNHVLVKQLESGRAYSFRVVPVGSAGPGGVSDITTARPL